MKELEKKDRRHDSDYCMGITAVAGREDILMMLLCVVGWDEVSMYQIDQ